MPGRMLNGAHSSFFDPPLEDFFFGDDDGAAAAAAASSVATLRWTKPAEPAVSTPVLAAELSEVAAGASEDGSDADTGAVVVVVSVGG